MIRFARPFGRGARITLSVRKQTRVREHFKGTALVKPGPLELYRRHDRAKGCCHVERNSRAAARLLTPALPLQHTKRIVRESVDIETCI